MKKRILGAVLVACTALTALSGCAAQTVAASKTQGTSKAHYDNLILGLAADGRTVLPITSLNFEVAGFVSKLYVEVGDYVEAGALLAELDDTDYQTEITNAKNNLGKAEASYNDAVNQRNYNLTNSEKNLESMQKKLGESFDSYSYTTQITDAETTLARKEKELADAQKNVLNPFDDYTYKNQIADAEISLARKQADLEDAKKTLQGAPFTTVYDALTSLERKQKELADAIAGKTFDEYQYTLAINEAKINLERKQTDLAEAEKAIEGNAAGSNAQQAAINEAKINLDRKKVAQREAEVNLAAAKSEVFEAFDPYNYQKTIDSAKLSLERKKADLTEVKESKTEWDFWLETGYDETGYNNWQKSIATAETAVKDAETALKTAETELARAEASHNKSNDEQRERDVESAQTQLTSAKNAVTDAQRSYDKAKADANKTLESAQTAVTDAERSLEKAVNDLARAKETSAEDNTTKIETLTTSVEDAQKSYEKALNDAQKTVDTNQKSVDDAVRALEKAKNDMERARETAATDAQKKLETAQDALMDAQTNLAKAQTNLTRARDEYYKNLETTKDSYDLAAMNYNNEKNSDLTIQNALLNIEDAKTKLEEAENNLNKVRVYAPSNGKILNISQKEGERINAQDSIDTRIFGTSNVNANFITLCDVTEVFLTSSISEADIAGLSMEQVVNITIDALGEDTLYGKIYNISSIPSTDSSGITTYTVTIRLDEYSSEIRDGMNALLKFIKKERSNVLIIPNKSVFIEDNQQFVNVVKSDGTYEKRAVICGLSDGSNTEVAKGLDEGETVVVGKVTS